MKHVALLAAVLAAWMPAQGFAQDAPQPKYPPGFISARLRLRNASAG